VSNLLPQYHHQAIRKETSDEQALLTQRVGWLLATQGFLLSAFAVSLGVAMPRFWWFTCVVVPGLGSFISYLCRFPIEAAVATIDFWRTKEQEFYRNNPEFQPLNLSERGEIIHVRSLQLPRVLPRCFLYGWPVLGAITCLWVLLQFGLRSEG
jgi:hypothetical protein